MTEPKELTVEEMSQALVGGLRARSMVYRWMLDNYDEFERDLKTYGRHWEGVAAKFAEKGYKDGHGNNPSAETCRHTWANVRKFVAEQRRRAAKGQAAPRLGPILPPSPQVGLYGGAQDEQFNLVTRKSDGEK